MPVRDLREAMVEGFIQAVDDGEELLVAVSDSSSTSKITPFLKKYPNRVINVGIAEQNLVGMAAGLALGGYVVATANAAPFLANRSTEQIRNDVAYSETNVKMMGLNPGIAYGSLGATHHAIGDIGIMRGFGGVNIYTPVDPRGTGEAIREILNNQGPAYVRIDSGRFPDLPRPEGGCGIIDPLKLTSGNDVTLLGLGTTAHTVKDAAEILASRGIEAEAWAIPSIRPLDTSGIIESMSRTGLVISAEAHSIHGGLGSLVCERVAERGMAVRMKRLGIPEGVFAPASPRTSIEKHFSLDAEGIAAVAERLLNNE